VLPILTLIRKIGQAVAAGCTMVVKPAQQTRQLGRDAAHRRGDRAGPRLRGCCRTW
jgi:acyl-CoA reductase-like NAD-dependent aldehyde dehydrogenase